MTLVIKPVIMAKYSSVFKIVGKLGDRVFIGGTNPHVRMWDSSRSKMMKTDKRFKNLRKVQSDFGLASTLGKKIRNALEPFTSKYKNTTISGRLTGTLFSVINKDAHPKGQRMCDLKNYGVLLKGFEFNGENRLFEKQLLLDYQVVNGGIRFTSFQFQKKGSFGSPYLDVVTLLVPEHVSASNLNAVIRGQTDSFRITGEVTIALQIPPGMVGLVFVGLYFKDGQNIVYSGMKVLGVFNGKTIY